MQILAVIGAVALALVLVGVFFTILKWLVVVVIALVILGLVKLYSDRRR